MTAKEKDKCLLFRIKNIIKKYTFSFFIIFLIIAIYILFCWYFKINTSDSATIFIALCVLFTSLYAYLSTKKHNILSVVPDLDYHEHIDEKEKFLVLKIQNNGLGPAKIYKIRIIIDNNELVFNNEIDPLNHMRNALDPIFNDLEILEFSYKHVFNKTTLVSQEQMQFLKIKFRENSIIKVSDMRIRLSKIKIKINYRSLYNEEFYYEYPES